MLPSPHLFIPFILYFFAGGAGAGAGAAAGASFLGSAFFSAGAFFTELATFLPSFSVYLTTILSPAANLANLFCKFKCHFALVIFRDDCLCFCICTHKFTLKFLDFWGFFLCFHFCFCFCGLRVLLLSAGAAAGAAFLGSASLCFCANTVVTKATLIRTANTIIKAFFIL